MEVRHIVVRGVRDVALETARIADAPGSGEVLIRTEATFISAGTELANYTALDPTVHQSGAWNAYPWQAGYANCGRVIAVGPEVERFTTGQRVFSFGRHVSHHYQTVGDPRGMLLPVPEGLAPDVAAAARMAAVAISALQTSAAQLNDWVAVFGLGLVGNLACQFFQLAGARVVGLDPLAARRELATRVGIQHVAGGTPDEMAAAVRELAGSEGAATTVDAVGESRVIEQAAALTAPHGELILLGSPRAAYQTDLTAAIRPVHWRWVTLKGALEWRIPRYPTPGARHSTYQNLQTVFDLVGRNRLKVAELISQHLQPDRIKDAYEALLNDKERTWGVVLDWTAE